MEETEKTKRQQKRNLFWSGTAMLLFLTANLFATFGHQWFHLNPQNAPHNFWLNITFIFPLTIISIIIALVALVRLLIKWSKWTNFRFKLIALTLTLPIIILPLVLLIIAPRQH